MSHKEQKPQKDPELLALQGMRREQALATPSDVRELYTAANGLFYALSHNVHVQSVGHSTFNTARHEEMLELPDVDGKRLVLSRDWIGSGIDPEAAALEAQISDNPITIKLYDGGDTLVNDIDIENAGTGIHDFKNQHPQSGTRMFRPDVKALTAQFDELIPGHSLHQ